jgi:hypothetical protein
MIRLVPAALAALLLTTACAAGPAPELPVVTERYALAAEFLIPTGTGFPAAGPLRFGGISGFAIVPGTEELLAISDDHNNSRVYRLRMTASPSFAVTPIATIMLQPAPGGAAQIDPEGIALTERGTMLVSTEGLGQSEPRTPPTINEYALDGRFVGEVPVPARFFPNERGPLTTGVRSNAGFESLTITPGFRTLYTANELPLVQDGDDATVAQGAGGQVRILRYVQSETGMGYAPAQQFAYEIAPLDPLPFKPQLVVNGVVELVALRDGELLVLERAYAQAEDPGQSINRARVYHATLSGATDVSLVPSLKGGKHTLVRKTLVADLDAVQGLSPALRRLDNFEALAMLPGRGAAERTLLIASDNNFNARQVTAFLLLSLRR